MTALETIANYVPSPDVLIHVLFSVHWCIGTMLAVTVISATWVYGGTKGALISVLAGYVAILALPFYWSQSVAPSTYYSIQWWMPWAVAFFMAIGYTLRYFGRLLEAAE